MIDREAQRRILERLAAHYPEQIETVQFVEEREELNALSANVAYLEEHGLVAAVWSRRRPRPGTVVGAVITARGMDFLADDGGLSAILGVVTVKLHEEDIKALLLAKVEASGAPTSVKQEIRNTIQTLPAEALRSVVMRGVDGFLSKAPDLISSIRHLLP